MKPIFSDDPQAIEKLQLKIEELTRYQEHMKTINKGYKKHGLDFFKTVDKVTAHYCLNHIKNAYSWEKNAYPEWQTSNNAAVIRQTKKRLEQLQKRKSNEG